MTDRLKPASPSPADSYSPRLCTALLLTGTGTAGAYHAGVLRALHEAGVKLDIVAGLGIGVMGALFAAIDGAQRLWDEKGLWRSPAVTSLYQWRWALRVAVKALAVSLAVVILPLGAIALGLVVFPIDFILRMAGVGGAHGLMDTYLRLAETVFAPEALPTWLPRLVVLVLGATAALLAGAAWTAGGARRQRGGFWWRVVRAPLSAAAATDQCWRAMWDLLRGATQLKQPATLDLARRYVELLADNLGQPGFRELLLTVHDVDAGRDLVFALVAESRRRDLVRPTTGEAEERRASVFDLCGVARDYLPDAVAGALSVPVATEVHPLTFAPDSYWRGETHRLCDRPGSLARILDELSNLGVEQVVVVSAAPEPPGPHALSAPRLDVRGRIGEYLRSAEAAAVHDLTHTGERGSAPRIFAIRPGHNPIGPFDFGGGFDERSDRRQPLQELLNRGYEDAYHQFIEPVVGASGERVGRPPI